MYISLPLRQKLALDSLNSNCRTCCCFSQSERPAVFSATSVLLPSSATNHVYCLSKLVVKYVWCIHTRVGEWLCACVRACVRVYVLGSVGVHALRIVSPDKILCCKNTSFYKVCLSLSAFPSFQPLPAWRFLPSPPNAV